MKNNRINILSKELETLLNDTQFQLGQMDTENLYLKPKPESWSKVEIFGHLIDSAKVNLQRFETISKSKKKYQVESYAQADLVRQNAYQEADFQNLLALWLSINWQIEQFIRKQPEVDLKTELFNYTGETCDLRFLIEDYMAHMRYHLKQILT